MGAAFTGLCLVHKFPFDPTGDGFPSFGSWMSRDRGGNRVPFCLPPPLSAIPSPQRRCSVKISLTEGGHSHVIVMQRGLVLMEVRWLVKSSAGVFWKSKPPRWDQSQPFSSPRCFLRCSLTRRWDIGGCMWSAHVLKLPACH